MKKSNYNLRTLMIIIAIIAHTFKAYCQIEQFERKKVGVAMGTSLSGNGHGVLYVPQLTLSNNRSSLLLGVCLQRRLIAFSGVRSAYSFILNFKTKKVEDEEYDENPYEFFKNNKEVSESALNRENGVNFKIYVYSEYLKNNILSQSVQKMEIHVNRVEGQNWKETKLSTIEGGLGFEIGVRLAKNLYWNTFIAASFYFHTTYVQNMHHERFSPTISFGTNINIPCLGGA